MVRNILKRRHRITRRMVEEKGWNHPRPSADPRLLMLAAGFAYVSFVQTFFSAPQASVSAQAYDGISKIAVMILVLLGTAFLFYAAFCDSQYSSWGWEAASCMMFAGQAAIQFYALVSVNDQWWKATTIGWTIFWGLGNLIRGRILIGRIW